VAIVAAAPGDAELLFWQSIMDSQVAADYRAYLVTFPHGQFARLAVARGAAAEPGAPVRAEIIARAIARQHHFLVGGTRPARDATTGEDCELLLGAFSALAIARLAALADTLSR
jgi:hypothetical protein